MGCGRSHPSLGGASIGHRRRTNQGRQSLARWPPRLVLDQRGPDGDQLESREPRRHRSADPDRRHAAHLERLHRHVVGSIRGRSRPPFSSDGEARILVADVAAGSARLLTPSRRLRDLPALGPGRQPDRVCDANPWPARRSRVIASRRIGDPGHRRWVGWGISVAAPTRGRPMADGSTSTRVRSSKPIASTEAPSPRA